MRSVCFISYRRFFRHTLPTVRPTTMSRQSGGDSRRHVARAPRVLQIEGRCGTRVFAATRPHCQTDNVQAQGR